MEFYVKQGGVWVACPAIITSGAIVYLRSKLDTGQMAALGVKAIVYLPSSPPAGQERIGWERADTADEPRYSPVYAYKALSRSQWRTLVKGLPVGARTALRNAVVAANVDGATDAAYFAAQLLDGEPTMPHARVISALAAVGLTLSEAQTDAFNARWAEVATLS